MTDPGDNNTIVGHRRWILYPPTQTMGVGDIPGESDSLFVIQPQTTPVPAVTTVAWPPAGFVPAPFIPDRWSLQAPYGSDFSNATVTVTENGVAQQVEILSNSGEDYGGQAIVWDMPDAPAPQPGQQVVYAVEVDNVVINGQTQSFSYTTTSFDPTTTTALTPVPAAVGFVQTSAQVDPAAGSITIDVACSMNTDQPVSVDYSTADGTAVAGTNYVATSGVLTFRAGAVLQSDRRSPPAGYGSAARRDFHGQPVRDRAEQASGRSVPFRSRSRPSNSWFRNPWATWSPVPTSTSSLPRRTPTATWTPAFDGSMTFRVDECRGRRVERQRVLRRWRGGLRLRLLSTGPAPTRRR